MLVTVIVPPELTTKAALVPVVVVLLHPGRVVDRQTAIDNHGDCRLTYNRVPAFKVSCTPAAIVRLLSNSYCVMPLPKTFNVTFWLTSRR